MKMPEKHDPLAAGLGGKVKFSIGATQFAMAPSREGYDGGVYKNSERRTIKPSLSSFVTFSTLD